MYWVRSGLIARLIAGDGTAAALTEFCSALDRTLEPEQARASVHRVREHRIWHLASSVMPAAHAHHIDGMQVGPEEATCGAAAALGTPVFTPDVLRDRRWSRYMPLVRACGIAASWSIPVEDSDGAVLATLVFHFPQTCEEPPARLHPYLPELLDLIRLALVFETRWLVQEDQGTRGLRHYMAHSPIGCIEWDTAFRVARCNDTAARLFGFPPEEFPGVPMTALASGSARGLATRRIAEELHADSGQSRHVEGENLTREGTPIICEWFSTAMVDTADNVTGYFSLVHDVTESRLLRDYVRSLGEAVAGQGTSWDMQALAGQVRTLLDADMVVVTEALPGGQRLRILAGESRTGPQPVFEYDLAGTPCEQVLQNRICIYPHGLQALFPEDVWLVEMNAHSYAGAPLLDANGRVFGLISAINHRAMGPPDVLSRLLRMAALRVGGEIQRQRAEQALRLSALAFETHEAIGIMTPAGEVIRVNRAFTRLSGYEPQAIIGRGLNLLYGRDGAGETIPGYQEALAGDDHWRGECWARHRDGRRRLHQVSLTLVRGDHGQVNNLVVSFLDITRSHEAEQQIQRLTFEDSLTGLPNRAALLQRLGRERGNPALEHTSSALVEVELERVQQINETTGYAAGDAMLQIQASRLRTAFRGASVIARVGPARFAAVLTGLPKQADDAVLVLASELEAVRRSCQEPVTLGSEIVQSGMSLGVTLFGDTDLQPTELLSQADLALTHALHLGGSRVCFFDACMQAAAEQRVQLERDLRQALIDGGVVMHVQPQVDVHGRVVAAEALARWMRDGQEAPPLEFIPLAEETGLIHALGRNMLHAACGWIADWNRKHPDHPLDHVSVNVSARQFHEGDLVGDVRKALEAAGIAGDALLLEVTESLLLGEQEDIICCMEALRCMGIRFSIDDFGTGYSSLAYVKRLPIDEVKIDSSFVATMLERPEEEAIVQAILAMADSLGLEVVAEGVETEEQAHHLYRLGCRRIQGYYCGHPMPPEAFEALALGPSSPRTGGAIHIKP